MGQKLQHTSPEMLIHPGETILEAIQDRNITQKELAIRTGFTEKHISTVINGKKNISAEFAKRLEYALGIPASFWRNLQTNYDLEVVEFNELHDITEEEKQIANELIKPVEKITGTNVGPKNGSDTVYNLRKMLSVSNLKSMSTLNPAFYRAQFAKNTSDNIMYVWQYLCEKSIENQTDNSLDVEKLKDNLDVIKNIMHEDPSKHIELIQEVLNECGIAFIVAKHVKKAPIKGLTVKTKKNQVMIALTIREKFVDIFWFTLFHEIGHVINGDYLKDQSDWEKNRDMEDKADKFAANILIDPKLYSDFIEKEDFSLFAVNSFAKENKVLPTIVIGRLMNDNKIPWTLSHYRERYAWVDEQ